MTLSLSVNLTNALIPLSLTIEREGAGGITGQSPTVALRDAKTTDSYLDWDDDTFKTTGWGTKYAPMSEAERGHYLRSLDATAVSAISSALVGELNKPLLYVAEFRVDDGGSVIGDASDLIAIDNVATNVELLRKALTNQLNHSSGDPGSLCLYDDDDSTVIKTWLLRDESAGAVGATVGSPARRSKSTP